MRQIDRAMPRRPRPGTSIQSMIYAESAKEALRRLKMYEYQQKTGKPALVKILHPFEQTTGAR